MKIVTVLGARPQFVKASQVSRTLASYADCKEVVIHTGQHYDKAMSEVFFTELKMPTPEYNLGIGSASHGSQTGKMLEKIEMVLMKESPDIVLVYGDTNSTLAGALAAVKLHIPVSHVEAGLRSFNKRMPEEINRVLTDHASDLLFTPTDAATVNLYAEGISKSKVHTVGDVMYDAAMFYGSVAEGQSNILDVLRVSQGEYILATIHRAENTDSAMSLRAIFQGLDAVSKELPVIMPLHPRTRAALERSPEIQREIQHIRFTEPVSYLDMIMLEKNSALIATDSGGVQKEAFFYKVPCVTLRDETEWVESVQLRWNSLVSPNASEKIAAAIRQSIGRRGENGHPYGDGTASDKIVTLMREFSR